jgi:hypothetical protein
MHSVPPPIGCQGDRQESSVPLDCHPERSEGSGWPGRSMHGTAQTLRCAQGDIAQSHRAGVEPGAYQTRIGFLRTQELAEPMHSNLLWVSRLRISFMHRQDEEDGTPTRGDATGFTLFVIVTTCSTLALTGEQGDSWHSRCREFGRGGEYAPFCHQVEAY